MPFSCAYPETFKMSAKVTTLIFESLKAQAYRLAQNFVTMTY